MSKFFTLVPKTNIDFVGMRKIGFIVSAVMMCLGLYGIVLIVQGKAKLGVDFGGGANVTLLLKNSVEVDGLRSAMGPAYKEADIQRVQHKFIGQLERWIGNDGRRHQGPFHQEIDARRPVAPVHKIGGMHVVSGGLQDS